MINNVVPRLCVHHTKSFVSPITLYKRTETEIGPVETRVTYINNLPVDVSIVDRSGFRHTVPSNHKGNDFKFTVRSEIKIRNESIREIKKYLSCLDTKFNHDLTIIKQVLLDGDNSNSFGGFIVYLDYSVELEELKQSGGSIYCKPKDIVISLCNIYNAPMHPFCEDSIQDYFLPDGADNQDLSSPVFKIELVDNNNSVGNRYVFAFGGLQEVRPKTDINRDSGVYLTMMESTVFNDKGFSFVQKKFTFEEAKEKLGMYKTREEAASAGDLHLSRKEELARLEHSNSILKHEFLEYKNKIELLTSQNDHEKKIYEGKMQERLDKLKAEKDEIEHFRELERTARKEDYERKSLERKDSSELIKILPLLVITIGSLIAAFSKSSK